MNGRQGDDDKLNVDQNPDNFEDNAMDNKNSTEPILATGSIDDVKDPEKSQNTVKDRVSADVDSVKMVDKERHLENNFEDEQSAENVKSVPISKPNEYKKNPSNKEEEEFADHYSDISNSSDEQGDNESAVKDNTNKSFNSNDLNISPACIVYQKALSTTSSMGSSARLSRASRHRSRQNAWEMDSAYPSRYRGQSLTGNSGFSPQQQNPSDKSQVPYDKYIGDWLRLHPKRTSKTYSSTTNSSYLARSNVMSSRNYPRAFSTQMINFNNFSSNAQGSTVRPDFQSTNYAGHVHPMQYSMYPPFLIETNNIPSKESASNQSSQNIREGTEIKDLYEMEQGTKDPKHPSSTNGSSRNECEIHDGIEKKKHTDKTQVEKSNIDSQNEGTNLNQAKNCNEPHTVNKTDENASPDTLSFDESVEIVNLEEQNEVKVSVSSGNPSSTSSNPQNSAPSQDIHVSQSLNSVYTMATAASTAATRNNFLVPPNAQLKSALPPALAHSSQIDHGVMSPNPPLEHASGIVMSIQDTPPEFSAGSNSLEEANMISGGLESNSNTDHTSSILKQKSEDDLHRSSPDSKYETYACRIDRSQGDASVEIPLFSFERPHMRAFHFSWISFFIGFFAWYAITPLLSEIQKSLKLSKEAIWTSSVCGVAGTAIFRIMAGPLCDTIGARWVAGVTLFLTAIPTMATGLVQGAVELYILRLLQGIAGSLFVTGMYWTSSMFTREVAGTANAVVAGWGNLGGGVTQVIMGSLLFPLFKWFYGETNLGSPEGTNVDNTEKADRSWRTVFLIPALLCFIFSFIVVRYSDDCPKGNYRKLKKLGLKVPVYVKESFRAGSREPDTWILFIQYACCFGVELTIANAAPLYFKEEYNLSTESAAAIASIFGWMNLFARGLGGFIGDITNVKFGMRGRLMFQTVILIIEGITVVIFSYINDLALSIVTLAIVSLFVQSAEGSTFGIVPYVNPSVTGSIVGIVGAGGNVGGVLFGLMFRQWDYRRAFSIMGYTTLCSSSLSVLISIKGQSRLFFREERRKLTSKPLAQDHRENEGIFQHSSRPED